MGGWDKGNAFYFGGAFWFSALLAQVLSKRSLEEELEFCGKDCLNNSPNPSLKKRGMVYNLPTIVLFPSMLKLFKIGPKNQLFQFQAMEWKGIKRNQIILHSTLENLDI